MKPIRILIFLLVPVLSSAQNIERAEPPFWWVHMQNTQLQIMLYGEEIGILKPEIHYDGISISKTISVDNLNYLFVYLNIHPNTIPGSFRIDLKDERGTRKCSFQYELMQREEGAAQRKGYDNSDVIYLVTPDRFSNGDTNNDAVEDLLELTDRGNKGGAPRR